MKARLLHKEEFENPQTVLSNTNLKGSKMKTKKRTKPKPFVIMDASPAKNDFIAALQKWAYLDKQVYKHTNAFTDPKILDAGEKSKTCWKTKVVPACLACTAIEIFEIVRLAERQDIAKPIGFGPYDVIAALETVLQSVRKETG